MDKPVNDATGGVEARDDRVEVPGVTLLVAAPYGPCEEVRQLDDTGRFRVDEHRDLGEIAEVAPPRASFPEASRQTLEGVLIAGFVHDDEAALRLSVTSPDTFEKQVEPVADFLEGVLHRIRRRHRLFVHNNSEGLDSTMGSAEETEAVLDDGQPLFPGKGSPPRSFTAIGDHAGVQFNVLGGSEFEALNEIVDAIDEVVNLPLEDSDASENEVTLVRVLNGSRTIKVKDVHSGLYGGEDQPGGAPGPLQTVQATAFPTEL